MIAADAFALGVGTAVAAGTLIGLERQWRQRMAGLRTNALVAAGAAMFVLLAGAYEDASPSRIAAQVVTGVGFLGAGVIMRDGGSITGINTAATLWCSAAVGCLAGGGQYLFALGSALTVVGVNIVLRSLARRLDRQPGSGDELTDTWRVEAVVTQAHDDHIRALLLHSVENLEGLRLQAVDTEVLGEYSQLRIDLTGAGVEPGAMERVVARIGMDSAVRSTSWRRLERPTADD